MKCVKWKSFIFKKLINYTCIALMLSVSKTNIESWIYKPSLLPKYYKIYTIIEICLRIISIGLIVSLVLPKRQQNINFKYFHAWSAGHKHSICIYFATYYGPWGGRVKKTNNFFWEKNENMIDLHNILSVPYTTANLYCICISTCFMFT